MSTSPAQWVQINYQKLKNIHISLCHITRGEKHVHSCLELGIVISGSAKVTAGKCSYVAAPGDLVLFNAYEEHKLEPQPHLQMLYMQFAPGFGKAYFAQVSSLEFENDPSLLDPQAGDKIRNAILATADSFYREPAAYGMECAGHAAQILTTLLRFVPYQVNSDTEHMGKKKRVGRQRRIAAFVEDRYREKLTLTQLAESEGITTAYMSRIFAELFGMPFQDYVSRLRLKKAIPLFKKETVYLVDICMECGFSDTRYLNAVCQKEYGCTAAQLRQKMLDPTWQDPHEQNLPADEIYDDETSLQLLKHFKEQNLAVLA